jgi:2'-5' RNA ligase
MANYFFGLKPTKESLFKILNYSSKLKNLFINNEFNFTNKENLHLTLLFLGKLTEEQVQMAKKILKGILFGEKSLSLNSDLNSLSSQSNLAFPYPSANLFVEFSEAIYLGEPPRLVCLSGKASFAILNLKKLLEKEAEGHHLLLKNNEKKNFLPHITLLRFPPQKKNLPQLPKPTSFVCYFETPALFTRKEQENGYYYLEV